MADWPTIPAGAGYPLVDASTGEFLSTAVNEALSATIDTVGAAIFPRKSHLPYNVKDFGAVGNGVADDTAAIQAAIDACSAAGGGVVYVPVGRYVVTQIVIKNYVFLKGDSNNSFGIAGYASRLMQKTGSNVDLVVFEQSSGDAGYLGPCGIAYFVLLGNASSTGGCGLATRTAAGAPLRWQDCSFMHHIQVRRFAGDGFWFAGGSALMNVSDLSSLWNGGYGFRFVNGGANHMQFTSLINFSADGNTGGAAIRIEGFEAQYAMQITALKSEQRRNTDRGQAEGEVSQQHAIELHNCAGTISVHGLEHISSNGNTVKPGHAIRITGTRPKIIWAGHEIRVLATQVDGSEPGLIQDVLTGRIIPRSASAVGSYGTTSDIRHTSASSASRYLFGVEDGHLNPSAVTPELGLSGANPGFVLVETDAAADAKVWTWMANNGELELRMIGDDASTGDRPVRVARTGKGSTRIGFYGATPVAKAASPGVASGTDAAVINAIVTALRNLGLVT